VPRRSENRAAPSARNPFTRSRALRACRSAALLALALAGVWSTDASAQSNTTSTITIGQNVGRRRSTDPIGYDGYPFRNARRWWVNYDECVANEYFDFYITLTNPRNRLEVWAGTEDCGSKRSLQDHGQCWIVASNDSPQQNFTVSVPVRNIVSNNVGVNSANIPDPEALGTAVCDTSTDSDGVQLKLYFFLQDGGQVVGSEQPWDPTNLGGVGYDMIGPAPPDSITTGMGESQLSINLAGVEPEPDRERFAAYCALADAQDGDAEFIPAADALTCPTMQLTPGARPDSALKCGEANETSNTITTDHNLLNDQVYAVGVSGEDIIGNAGPLSTLACGIPKPLKDFFELYGEAGGPGGGGFCNMSRPGSSHSPAAPIALFGGVLAAFTVRRGRKRS
jgi:hypothetical protein